ncbi:MAG: bifunctional oligoribonuclease/PAP phosphatase NrnA [Lachnospiraceae bacterium]|nr:bifunctional oligoribonuclease/PAP phosphatase NrnA [Lachnospiraceae bacterium]
MIDLEALVQNAVTIGIAGHTNPDGDCVGACLGLQNYLKKRYPDKRATVFLEQPSGKYSFLKGYDTITTPDKELYTEFEFDIFFALDSGDANRLGSAHKFLVDAKETVCIDHHISNTGFARHMFIEPEASSTSELIYDIIHHEYIDEEIAKCLYTGIIHDTGVLRFANTSPKTLRTVAELISYGFDFSRIIDESFYEKSYVQNQIMGRAVLESILILDGKCIFSALDHKTMDFYGVSSEDMDGIVNQLKCTAGVQCAIFMYEREPMVYKVSMRSEDTVDVSRIASRFGGGGHKRAAGFTMSGTVHDIINNVSEYVEKELEESEQL